MTFGQNVPQSLPGLTLLGYSANRTDGAGGLSLGDGGTANFTITRDGNNYFFQHVGHAGFGRPLVLQSNPDGAAEATVCVGDVPSNLARAKLWVRPFSGSQRGAEIHQQPSQSADLLAFVSSDRTTALSRITAKGAFAPPELADADAEPGTLYLSSTGAGVNGPPLAFKSQAGTIHYLI